MMRSYCHCRKVVLVRLRMIHSSYLKLYRLDPASIPMPSPISFAVAALAAGSCAAEQNFPISYDETWAGPVQLQRNGTSAFSFVEATLIIPSLQLPVNPREQRASYSASVWVGLDGYDSPYPSGLWQSGINMTILANGTTAYNAWYEWVPSDYVELNASQLSVSEGDSIRVQISTAGDGLRGSLTLANLDTAQVFTHEQDAPTTWRGPTFPARGASAEWIVEAGGSLYGEQNVFPDWGTVEFLGARACRVDGACVLPGGRGMITTAVKYDDTLYTRSRAEGGRVLIEYVEEPVDS
ncbi:concanavalin A-like lectin/glucanase domain-containing protein [Xylariaceae sp. FL0804]|nr:concanavalin A-like lectin/glucanase domain-containing protein [Xylariaceae sp. FL0804]